MLTLEPLVEALVEGVLRAVRGASLRELEELTATAETGASVETRRTPSRPRRSAAAAATRPPKRRRGPAAPPAPERSPATDIVDPEGLLKGGGGQGGPRP